MIDLHDWPTPNGWKVTRSLEQGGLAYRIVPVNVGRGEQFAPELPRISPNGRMPAIVDHTPVDGGAPVSVFESGAILIYLAGRTGRAPSQAVRPRGEEFPHLERRFYAVGAGRAVQRGRAAGKELRDAARAHGGLGEATRPVLLGQRSRRRRTERPA